MLHSTGFSVTVIASNAFPPAEDGRLRETVLRRMAELRNRDTLAVLLQLGTSR